jgi:hypothetical protein
MAVLQGWKYHANVTFDAGTAFLNRRQLPAAVIRTGSCFNWPGAVSD